MCDAMLGPGVRQAYPTGPRLNHAQREVLDALNDGAQSCEEVACDIGLSGEEALIALATLEALGYVDAPRWPSTALLASNRRLAP